MPFQGRYPSPHTDTLNAKVNLSPARLRTDIDHIDLAEVPCADEVLVHFQRSTCYCYVTPFIVCLIGTTTRRKIDPPATYTSYLCI